MIMSARDSGKTRQFYQILTAFVPGQTYNYSPVIKSGKKTISPNLTAVTKGLYNLDYIDQEKTNAIKYWSGGKIIGLIKSMSGRDIESFNLIGIRPPNDKKIKIVLDIFPKTFTTREETTYILTWDKQFIENARVSAKQAKMKLDIAQAQFVFCDSKGYGGIHQFDMRDRNNVLLKSSEEENWSNQRLSIDGKDYPLSTFYAETNNFEKILSNFNNYPFDWRFKPILSSALTVFMPIHFAGVLSIVIGLNTASFLPVPGIVLPVIQPMHASTHSNGSR